MRYKQPLPSECQQPLLQCGTPCHADEVLATEYLPLQEDPFTKYQRSSGRMSGKRNRAPYCP